MVRKFLDLTDNDLKNNPYAYDEEQLLYTLQTYCPSLRILNRYQKLSAYICAKYVIFGGNNEEYGDCSEDRWLDDNDILRRQPHITREELLALAATSKIKLKESEIPDLQKKLKDIINYAERVLECVEQIQASSKLINVWREDIIKQSDPEKILSLAPQLATEGENVFFLVPKVIEK